MTESLEQYFRTKKVQFVIPGMVVAGGPDRTYDNLDDLVKEVENARVWGGLHYRNDDDRRPPRSSRASQGRRQELLPEGQEVTASERGT